MFTGGFSQGILNGMQATRDNAAQDTDLAYKKQLMAMQAIALENARSQQAKSQQWDQMAGYEDALNAPPPTQPPAPGQASVPMQQAPQGPSQGQPQGLPPGLMNGMGMRGPPPGQPPQQQMAPPQGAMMAPGQPMPQQQAAPLPPIPPYKSMQGMQQGQQSAPMQAPPSMGPLPSGAPSGGGMPAPGSMQNASPFQNADTTPEQASQAAAAQIMKLATGPDSYTVMKQNVMQHLIANGVPPQQADQQAAQYLANSPAAQTKLKAMEAQRKEALEITEKAQTAADAAYKSVLLKQSQHETEVRDKNTAEYQKGELGVQRGNLAVSQGRLGLDRQKAAVDGGGPASSAGASDPYKVAEKFGVSKAAFEKDADRFNLDGTLPSNTRNQKNMPYVTAIKNLAAERNPDANPGVNKTELSGLKATYSDTVKREAAVDRITGSIEKLQARATELTKRLNGTIGGDWKNQKINDLRSKFTDNADLKELDNLMYAVGRDYVAATTMPGSNAQMHISSGDKAESMANRNMTPGNLEGALKGINEDISASKESLGDVKKRIDKDMRGMSAPSSGSKPSSKTVNWSDLK